MNEVKFWRLIKAARAIEPISKGVEILEESLSECQATEIVAFLNIFRTQMAAALTRPSVDACFLLNGSLADDVFEDFSAWLIYQGKEFFEAAIQQPEVLFHHLPERELASPTAEALLFAAHRAFARHQKVGVDDKGYLDCLLSLEEHANVQPVIEADEELMTVPESSWLSKHYPSLYQWHMLNVEAKEMEEAWNIEWPKDSLLRAPATSEEPLSTAPELESLALASASS